MNPNHVKTLCALATLERRCNHHKAAKVHLRKALGLQPTNPVALRVSWTPSIPCTASAIEGLQACEAAMYSAGDFVMRRDTHCGPLLQAATYLHAGNEHSAASDWRVWHGIDPPKRGSQEQQKKQAGIYR